MEIAIRYALCFEEIVFVDQIIMVLDEKTASSVVQSKKLSTEIFIEMLPSRSK